MPDATTTSKKDSAPEPSKKPKISLTGKGRTPDPDPDQVTGEATVRGILRGRALARMRKPTK